MTSIPRVTFHLSVEINEAYFSSLFQEPGSLFCLCTSVSPGAAPQQQSSSCLILIWWPEPNVRDKKAPNQHKLKQSSVPFVKTSLARAKHLNTDVPLTFSLHFTALFVARKVY